MSVVTLETADQAFRDLERNLGVSAYGGSGTAEGRDSWCTPKWLADLLGTFDVDPCSNERSHISAHTAVKLDENNNGLVTTHPRGTPLRDPDGVILYRGQAERVVSTNRVFINPPYGHGEVARWVKHYAHTDFTFLLRWDPSTAWFAQLLPRCSLAWFPNRRINFEPPPGVNASSNPFPHALYFKNQPPKDVFGNLSDAGYFLMVS